MEKVTLFGMNPLNNRGLQFKTDAETWRLLSRLLIISRLGPGFEEEEVAGLLCGQDGARCPADKTSELSDRLIFWVERIVPEAFVAASIHAWPSNGEAEDNVEPCNNCGIGISVETLAAFQRFLGASRGFVLKLQLPTPDGNVIQ